MAYERTIKRYSAYYLGWCQAFGEHDISFNEEDNINWLYGESINDEESRIGIVLAPKIRKILFRELLTKSIKTPTVVLSDYSVKLNELTYTFTWERDRRGFEKIMTLLQNKDEMHMFLTSHFCYPPGTRIITFSTKRPLVLMYKEIEPLGVKII